MLAEQQVIGIDLLIHPDAALVLIDAHAPVAHDVALFVADVVGEIHELLLEGVDRLIVVALGELRHELERVGLDALFEVLKGNLPVLAGSAAGILLLDDFAFLPALGDGFPLVELHGELTRHHVLFGREGELVRIAKAEADVGDARAEDAVLFNVGLIDLAAADDLAKDEVENREVRIRTEDDDEVGEVRRARTMRRELNDARVLVGKAAVGHARPEHRMSFSRVVAPENDGVGLFNVGVAVGRFVNAEGLVEADHGGRHAEARIGVDVVRAEAALHEL